jgi:hypothetical protein
VHHIVPYKGSKKGDEMSRQGPILISGTREWVRWKALDQADTLSEFYGIPSKTADDSCIFVCFRISVVVAW